MEKQGISVRIHVTKNITANTHISSRVTQAHLHKENSVEYVESFGQCAGNIGVLVKAEYPGSRGHGHCFNALHIAAMGVFGIIIYARVDAVFIKRIVRVEYLQGWYAGSLE